APEVARKAEGLAPEAPEGGRIPLQTHAGAWRRTAVETLERGVVVAVDYADTTPSMAARPWTDWVRTYRGHGRGGHPLQHLGEQDITCEAAVDQLDAVHPASRDRSQAEFLFDLNLASMVAEARRNWEERAHIGDLEALKHRSRLTEADA